MELRYTAPVETTGGSVRGYYEEGDIMVFKGIPYGESTAGEGRFRAPRPYEKRDGVRDCVEFAPCCYQNKIDELSARIWTKEFIIQSRDYSEDCLNLNLWTKEGGSRMPVIVYFYGGGFVSGGSSCEIYDGVPFVKKGVIYITFNKRENVFGWLSCKELDEESENGCSGNYALMDDELALEWIRDNIEAFGGDPENVTIWGQSSGAVQVNLLSVSRKAAPLYKNVVSMGLNSFPERNTVACSTRKEADENAGKLLDEYGHSVERLREVPPETFLDHTYIKGPVNDGVYVCDSFRNEVTKGANPDKTMMMGMVGRDFTSVPMFMVLRSVISESDKKEALVQAVNAFYPGGGEKIIDEYGVDPGGSAEDKMKEIFRLCYDAMIYELLEFARVRNKTCKGKTYIYLFTHVMPGPESELFGSFHSCEVPYFTEHLSDYRGEYWTAADRDLAVKMNTLITGFAKDGVPGIDGFVPSDGTNLFLITADEQKNVVYEKETLDRWNALFGGKDNI
ncbi:MAG: carboxylesterase family protein [Eubacterium sp.]|nr:carboxylesterase family protein [Eubacterium sp.]